jgi:DnaJ like chaperone protein
MRLAQVFKYNNLILEEILTGLFIVAASDSMGLLSPAEANFLGRVASMFEFTVNDFVRIAARSGVRLPTRPSVQTTRDMNYVVLGLPEDASPETIKKTYHALIRKHHPDRLAAQGLPQELVAQATEKMKRINAAYDAICKSKGIR